MTQPESKDVCRVMAEQIYEDISTPMIDNDFKEEDIRRIDTALRDHTIVLDLLELCHDVSLFRRSGPTVWSELQDRAKRIEIKVEGR